MRRSVVFVHGTGVREASYNSTFRTVRTELGGLRPDWEVHGCLWGPAEGAKFVYRGASIPGYTESGGGKEKDARTAAWGVLHSDPGYELRLLGLRPAPQARIGGVPPSRRFLADVRDFQPSPGLLDRVRRHELGEEFETALHTVRSSAEVRDAAATADANGHEHRHAVARAVVAATLAAAEARGKDALDGVARDALLAALSTELHGNGRSLLGKVGKAAKDSAKRAATRRVVDRRGALTDGALPMVGDILRYQARGDGVRRLIEKRIEDTPGDAITLVAHSLGGVACVDLLAGKRIDRVDQLITIGSQAPFFYECGALTAFEHPDTLPAHFPGSWLNIYDSWDLLAYGAAKVFEGRAHDVEVSSGQPFPLCHSAYWSNREVWSAVDAWLN